MRQSRRRQRAVPTAVQDNGEVDARNGRVNIMYREWMHRNYLLDIYPLIAGCCLLELIYYCGLRSGGGGWWAEGSDRDSQQAGKEPLPRGQVTGKVRK